MGMRTVCAQRARAAPLSPLPSLPTRMTARRRSASRISGVSSRRAEPARGSPASSARAWSSSREQFHAGSRNTAPMEDRTVLGFQRSAHPGRRNTPSASKASAVRTMVPTFPGSWTPSRARYRRPERAFGSAPPGQRAVNRAPWGASMGLMDFITSSGTSARRTPAGSSGRAAPAVYTTAVRSAPQRTASSRSFTPSPRNSPVSRRKDREAPSFRTRTMRGLARLVMCSAIGGPPLPGAGPLVSIHSLSYRRAPVLSSRIFCLRRRVRFAS